MWVLRLSTECMRGRIGPAFARRRFPLQSGGDARATGPIGYGPVIQYGIGIQLPEAERTPRVLAVSYTEKEWRAVARAAFDNPRGLAERAMMNELWKELHTSRGNEFAEAVEGNMFGMLMAARDEASHLLDTRPDVVVLPDYDPELIMSSEPISGVRTRITPEEHTRAQDALLGS